MAFDPAATDRVLVGVKEETSYGEFPSGNIHEVRYRSESFGQENQTTISQEVRSDRMVPDFIRTGIRAQGGVRGELSYGATSFELFLKHILGAANDFTTPPTQVTAELQFIASSNTIVTDSTGAGTDFSTAEFAPGNWIRVSGATNAANNGYFQISARDTGTATAHEITVVGGTLVDEAAASRNIQSSAAMRNGVAKHSLSVEKQWLDRNSGSGLAARLLGYRSGQIQLGLTPEAVTTYQIGGQAKFLTDTAGNDFSDPATQTPDFTTLSTVSQAPLNDVMNTVDGIGQLILRRDNPITDATISQLNLTIQSALRRQTALGTGLGVAGIGIGRITLSGDLSAYFETTALLEEALFYNDMDVAVVSKDNDGNAYLFDVPRLKLGGDPLPKGDGNDRDAVISTNLGAARSQRYGLDYQIAVHKFAAP